MIILANYVEIIKLILDKFLLPNSIIWKWLNYLFILFIYLKMLNDKNKVNYKFMQTFTMNIKTDTFHLNCKNLIVEYCR